MQILKVWSMIMSIQIIKYFPEQSKLKHFLQQIFIKKNECWKDWITTRSQKL